MNLDENKKADVLLAALSERYTAMHNIRERVQSVGIWALGLFLGAGGWLIQSELSLGCDQKVLMILGVIMGVFTIHFFYLADLENGFRTQQRVTVRLESALGFFTPGELDDKKEPVFPESWQKSGTENGDGRFFRSTYLLLYAGAFFLSLSVFLAPIPL